MSVRILRGDVRDKLAELEDESVHCVVTSPPYWGLRDYGLPPSIWGGDETCEHEFEVRPIETEAGRGNWAQGTNGRGEVQPGGAEAKREAIKTVAKTGFCAKCGAWKGQLGLEPKAEQFIEHVVSVFRDVHRVLRRDGTLWLNIGDSYSTSPPGNARLDHSGPKLTGSRGEQASSRASHVRGARDFGALKSKDLVGIPWMLAFALRADGWYLRQDIIWHKPNPMPESVRDRCTKSHECLFLLSKSERYYYDDVAIREPLSPNTNPRAAKVKPVSGWDTGPGAHEVIQFAQSKGTNGRKFAANDSGIKSNASFAAAMVEPGRRKSGNAERKYGADRGLPMGPWGEQGRHQGASVPWEGFERTKRSVWSIVTEPFPQAHFATFPTALVEPCILAGCPPEGKRCDCAEVIRTPAGKGGKPDPSMTVGRAGMARPRGDDEGVREITRLEQRWHAQQMKDSPHQRAMRRACGPAFDHYVRTDKSGARPLPEFLRKRFMTKGWITEPPPCTHPIEPAGVVLDPFGGAGTTGLVAASLDRHALLIELNPEYADMADRRIHGSLFAEASA